MDDVKIWRKELVRGRPIVIRHGSKGVTKLQSLGPLPSTQDVRAIIQKEIESLSKKEESFPAEQTIKDVVMRAGLSRDRQKRMLCLEKLEKGEYVTLPEGTSRLHLPPGATTYGYHGGDKINGKTAFVLFIIAKGDSPAFDDSEVAHRSAMDAYVEDVVGTFNNRPLPERKARIKAHFSALEKKKEVYESKNLSQSQVQARISELDKSVIDLVLSQIWVDRNRFVLARH